MTKANQQQAPAKRPLTKAGFAAATTAERKTKKKKSSVAAAPPIDGAGAGSGSGKKRRAKKALVHTAAAVAVAAPMNGIRKAARKKRGTDTPRRALRKVMKAQRPTTKNQPATKGVSVSAMRKLCQEVLQDLIPPNVDGVERFSDGAKAALVVESEAMLTELFDRANIIRCSPKTQTLQPVHLRAAIAAQSNACHRDREDWVASMLMYAKYAEDKAKEMASQYMDANKESGKHTAASAVFNIARNKASSTDDDEVTNASEILSLGVDDDDNNDGAYVSSNEEE